MFDFDAYCEKDDNYINEEIQSINENGVFIGGISNEKKTITIEKENCYPESIINNDDINEFLKILITSGEGPHNPNLTEARNGMLYKYHDTMKRRTWR